MVPLPNSLSKLRQRIGRQRLLPGITVIGLVMLARALGLFQTMELRTLDTFLRWRPAEPKDERMLIVGIDEDDIQQVGTYPIPDEDMAKLLEALLKHNPRVVGIDLYRDLAVEPGHQKLANILATQPNIIGVEKIIGDPAVSPPADLPPEQVGFGDLPLDPDGFVRRAYLGSWPAATTPDPDRLRFSLSLRLAETYLAAEGLELENGIRDDNNMRFGDTEFFNLSPRAGGYARFDNAGWQFLINPRSGRAPFDIVSMVDVIEGRVNSDLIQDRIVIIGITTLSVKDLVNSAAIKSNNPGLINGVEMHTHITSQLVSTVLDNRPMVRIWADGWEYLLIILLGSFGLWLGYIVRHPARYILFIGITVLGIASVGLVVLWLGSWWVPVVPTLIMTLAISGLGLPSFYLYDQMLRSRIDERQQIIERTYDAIHNGPLQTLATLLQQKDDLTPAISNKLETLNQEIRAIYVGLLQESLPEEHQLQLGTKRIIDLRDPIKEVLHNVYTTTLERDFPGFASLKIHINDFQPLAIKGLSSDNKRALCRFLEEALCNVGKHAISPKRLTVLCITEDNDNVIRIEDNGQNDTFAQDSRGRGTQQAERLAKRLRGTFRREVGKTGTLCELRWPISGAGRYNLVKE
ncbi:CHASE2 domain-containing protein [Adonisia turfae]|uniref:CHASE2 domain-containing protein n=1 Tax=Adonisia turfae CCMR0081 TaxID=2292702 RepID=A0A6M0RQD8_9CYAN|nr:CHASE2 domain-containing protein [Adonisia turfae]NEZ58457.1 CHASE2 domain-containing protein [Adonisia turfae CCMR0081]